MSNKPRLVFFMPTLNLSGAGRHTVDLAYRLRLRRYSCQILVHGSKSSPTVMAMPGASDAKLLKIRGMSQVSGWLRTWRALRQAEPDIVVSINQTLAIVAAVEKSLLATRAKLACIFHTTVIQRNERHQIRFFRWALRITDKLIYVGENQAATWRASGVRPRSDAVILDPHLAARAARSERQA